VYGTPGSPNRGARNGAGRWLPALDLPDRQGARPSRVRFTTTDAASPATRSGTKRCWMVFSKPSRPIPHRRRRSGGSAGRPFRHANVEVPGPDGLNAALAHVLRDLFDRQPLCPSAARLSVSPSTRFARGASCPTCASPMPCALLRRKSSLSLGCVGIEPSSRELLGRRWEKRCSLYFLLPNHRWRTPSGAPSGDRRAIRPSPKLSGEFGCSLRRAWSPSESEFYGSSLASPNSSGGTSRNGWVET
jgi:hypothetical protein